MVPRQRVRCRRRGGRPRARGDGSQESGGNPNIGKSAPRTRGWFWAPAPTCRPGRVRTRGWFPQLAQCEPATVVGPAHAGWFAAAAVMLDGEPVGPAHAGMVPRVGGSGGSALGRPRARGDGSPGITEHARIDVSAPRTRGWFPSAVGQLRATPVGPAHAGMFFVQGLGACPSGVGPAHAGMVPSRSPTSRARRGRPRARGDGSSCLGDAAAHAQSAPRTRGWFRGLTQRALATAVGPAHAGMVPSAPARGTPPRVGPAHAGMVRIASPSAGFISGRPRTRGWFSSA